MYWTFPRRPQFMGAMLRSRHLHFFQSSKGSLIWGQGRDHRCGESASKPCGIPTLTLPEIQFAYLSMAVEIKHVKVQDWTNTGYYVLAGVDFFINWICVHSYTRMTFISLPQSQEGKEGALHTFPSVSLYCSQYVGSPCSLLSAFLGDKGEKRRGKQLLPWLCFPFPFPKPLAFTLPLPFPGPFLFTPHSTWDL